ncbi:acetolactate decarboxylase [soil metagenome]
MVPVLYQASAFDALRVGHYDGTYPVRDLTKHGDFGLGTFNALNGEMVVLDGRIYRISGFGEALSPAPDERTPFAFVTRFRPTLTVPITHPLSSAGLQAVVDKAFPGGIVAIRIKGRFDIGARSFAPQLKPYQPFARIMDRQSLLPYGAIEGDMVGFRMPKSVGVNSLNVPGYHFHFVSADRRHGGHVLRYLLLSGSIQMMPVGNIVAASP